MASRPASPTARLVGIAVAGLILLGLLAAFVLLFLRVPAGHEPITGWAPNIGAAYLKVFSYPGLSLGPRAFRVAAVGLVVAMWGVYTGAVFWTTRITEVPQRRVLLKLIAAVAVAGHVVLVLLPPVLSTDLFRCGLFGKMILAGDSPYLLRADELAGDPLWPYAAWTHLRAHYGPTFLWISTGATMLGGGGPIGTALAFKAVMAAFNLLGCWTVWALARLRENDDGLTALALYAWNPLVLVEGPGQAHPEAVMIPLALLGILLWWRGRPLTGWGVLLASAAVKYVTGVLLLLAAVKMVVEVGPGKRLGMAVRLLGVTLLVAAALYGPFWGGGVVFDQAVDVIVKGSSLDRARWTAPPDTPVVALAVFGLGLVGALAAMARLARPYVLDLSAGLISLFVMLVLYWRMPWYFVTAIGLTVAGGPTRSNRAVMLLALALGMLSMLLYCALVSTGKR